ncbi:putative NRPS-like protein biosynthetic cluster [Exophiala oligosperma]
MSHIDETSMGDMLGGPRNTGKRLLPHVVDYQAAHNPGSVFAIIPTNLSDHRSPWRNFSFSELARATDYTAWWLENNVRAEKGEPIAYLGQNDVRYMIFFLAFQAVGYKHIVHGLENEDSVREIKKASPDEVVIHQIPSLDDMLCHGATPFPFETTYEAEEDTIVAIFHSSGTTGMPKPVKFTNGYFSCYDNISRCKPLVDGRTYPFIAKLNGPHLTPAVFFHMMAFGCLMESILRTQTMLVVPERMMTERVLAEIIATQKPKSAHLVSSVVDSIYQAGYIDILSSLDFVISGGGPLFEAAGTAASQATCVIQAYGSTEAGILPFVPPVDRKDWNYIELLAEAQFELEYVEDGLFEAIIRRGPSREHQGIFHTHPDLLQYRTKDLFAKHPTKPNLITFRGRIDDVIVLSNGEKFNPSEMENIIEQHPKVSRAFILGTGRFEPALLLEVKQENLDKEESDHELIDEIWPQVIEANKICLAHGRIVRSRVAVADRSKPFRLNAKKNIQRRHTEHEHQETIDAIYSKSIYSHNRILNNDPTLGQVQEFVLDAMGDMLAISDLTLSSDIVSHGIDSLHILQISAFLIDTIEQQTGKETRVPAAWIYNNPTPGHMADIVYGSITGSELSALGDTRRTASSKSVEQWATEHTQGLPAAVRAAPPSKPSHDIILTGSTGSLGSYILDQLLKMPTVNHIYCFNRASDGRAKQIKSFEARGLAVGALTAERVQFYQVKYGEPRFGLSVQVYDKLLSSVDTVLHNAWEVNFNLDLISFSSHIRGVRSFVDFSLNSRHLAHVHLVSSRGAVAGWPLDKGLVPEAFFEDSSVADSTGYGTSKHISERILLAAARQSGVPVTIHRVGQVAGPTTEKGEWNRTEWFPTLMITSVAIGQIPDAMVGVPMDWIPVDSMARIFLELVAARRKTQDGLRSQVFHLNNPAETEWSDLLPSIQERFPIEVVPLRQWIETLDKIPLSQHEITKKPALKLLDFWKRIDVDPIIQVSLCTNATGAASETLRNLRPADQKLFDLYLRQWGLCQ